MVVVVPVDTNCRTGVESVLDSSFRSPRSFQLDLLHLLFRHFDFVAFCASHEEEDNYGQGENIENQSYNEIDHEHCSFLFLLNLPIAIRRSNQVNTSGSVIPLQRSIETTSSIGSSLPANITS